MFAYDSMLRRLNKLSTRLLFISRMHASKSCNNLCHILRKCLVLEPDIEKVEERIISVRCVQDEDKLSITTRLHGSPKHYLRMKADPLKNTLKRMRLNLTFPQSNHKHLKKKTKTKGGTQQHDHPDENQQKCYQEQFYYPNDVKIEVQKYCRVNSVSLNEETSNQEAWKEENVLMIGQEQFKIRLNAPNIISATLPSCLMAGYPVVPNLDFEFTDRYDSKFMWFRSNCSRDLKDKQKQHSLKKDKNGFIDCCEMNSSWEFVSNSFKYTPKNDDIGYKLKFICVPKRKDIFGFPIEIVSESMVEAGPGICPFDERHLYTIKGTSGCESFRVVSYNILADIYADSEFSRSHLYPYCSDYAINYSYRGQLILKEILGYNSDIICLQECDLKIFNNFFQPAMKEEGFDGYYLRKAGEMPEGEAIFFKESRFYKVREASVIVSEALEMNCNTKIKSALAKCPEMLESVKKRTAVGQIIAVRDVLCPSRVICILNTHLYFRPQFTNIRLIQMAVLLNHLRSFINEIETANGKTATLICGDLNSTPKLAVIEYLTKGHILENHYVWTENGAENGAENIQLDLTHDFKLFSACGFPIFTNYVVGFKDTLDYIMCDERSFTVKSCVPLPDETVLKLHTALPSVTVPSDHLALVCDLAWKA